MENQEKICQNCKIDFRIESEDFDFYKKINVPPPTWCPACRRIRRTMFRNERSLYRGTCDLCKRSMFSMYAPDSPYTVYCKECWFSDAWNPIEYAADYDFTKPFFEQFHELKKRVPRLATVHIKMNTNSEYANFLGESKNIYLAYSIVHSENIMYSRVVDDSRDSMDSSNLKRGELCYENIQSDNMNRVAYAYSCTNCVSSTFLFDCINCQDCFMSSNLSNKQYVFRNEQLTKETYQECLEGIDRGSHSSLRVLYNEYLTMMHSSLHKYADILKSVGCTGDCIWDSKNVRHSFDVYGSEESKYCDRLIRAKDSFDIYASAAGERNYEGMGVSYGCSGTKFVLIGDDMRDSFYTDYCNHSSNVFGCISLKKNAYCILNKQYSKQEYEVLVPKIIEHMNAMPYVDDGGRVYRYGEFFPPYQYAYNESIAQEDVLLMKEQALAVGYRWRDPDMKDYKVTLPPLSIPDHVDGADESVLQDVIGCEHAGSCNEQCTTAFKIAPQELQFYKQLILPLPRLCPNCRHYQRLKIRNPHTLWTRKCQCLSSNSASVATAAKGAALAKGDAYKNVGTHFHASKPCPNEFETSYSPDRPEIVYCESCYNSEVV